jgi:hypothetical protein
VIPNKEKKAMKKLKAITEANLKAKSSSISSNNRRTKKSAGRIERSKQILSRSWERKHSKKKHGDSKKRNKVIQIIQTQLINLKTPASTELVFGLKTNNTTKHEYIKRSNNESKLGFHRDRKSSLESTKAKISKIYDPLSNEKNITKKYNKLLVKASHFPYDLNKTVTSDMVTKKIGVKSTKSKSRNQNYIRAIKTEVSKKN